MGVSLGDVERARENLLQTMKAFVCERREEYAKIPFAALEVNGRHHWSGRLRCAYEKCIWWVNQYVYIDIKSGELRGLTEHVLSLSCDLRLIDPARILAKLQRQKEQEFAPYLERPANWESEKQALKANLESRFGKV